MAGLPPLSEFPPIGPNYGALLVGTFLSLMSVRPPLRCSPFSTQTIYSLYGVELHQVYRYTRLYSTDRGLIKCYVSV